MPRSIAAVLFVGLLSACGGGNNLPTGPTPVTAEVEFRYVVSEAKGPQATATFLPCSVSLHPSWWGFAQVGMVEVSENTWAILFEEVPIGRHTVRVEVPDGCNGEGLTANGIPLSVASSNESGNEAGGTAALGFTVHADGSVTP